MCTGNPLDHCNVQSCKVGKGEKWGLFGQVPCQTHIPGVLDVKWKSFYWIWRQAGRRYGPCCSGQAGSWFPPIASSFLGRTPCPTCELRRAKIQSYCMVWPQSPALHSASLPRSRTSCFPNPPKSFLALVRAFHHCALPGSFLLAFVAVVASDPPHFFAFHPLQPPWGFRSHMLKSHCLGILLGAFSDLSCCGPSQPWM